MDHNMKKNPVSIPHSIWPADDIKRLERDAADAFGLTLYELMLRAGDAAFRVARDSYPDARHWLVLCGHGNNGGDGYVRRGDLFKITVIRCDLTEFVVIQGDRRKRLSR